MEEATEMMADGTPVVNDGQCPIYGVESQRGDGELSVDDGGPQWMMKSPNGNG